MRLTLLLFSLLYAIASFCQGDSTRWRLGVQFSPDLCYRHLSPYDPLANVKQDISTRNFTEVPIFGFTTGMSAHYAFRSGLEIESGLYFSQKGYQQGRLYYLAQLTPSGPVYGYLRRIYRYQGIDIPLKANLLFGKGSWKLLASAGVAGNFFIEEQRTDKIATMGETDKAQSTRKDTYNKFMLTGEIGFGVATKLTNRLSLRAAPTFRYTFLNQHDENGISTNLWSIGLNIGCIYNL